jgi:hypothetical protein
MSIRLRQICLVAEKLAPVVDDFKAIFAIDVCFVDPAVAAFGLENSLMPIGGNFLEVVAPVKENTAAGRYLKRRGGDGGYMVICQCDSHATQLARKPAPPRSTCASRGNTRASRFTACNCIRPTLGARSSKLIGTRWASPKAIGRLPAAANGSA